MLSLVTIQKLASDPMQAQPPRVQRYVNQHGHQSLAESRQRHPTHSRQSRHNMHLRLLTNDRPNPVLFDSSPSSAREIMSTSLIALLLRVQNPADIGIQHTAGTILRRLAGRSSTSASINIGIQTSSSKFRSQERRTQQAIEAQDKTSCQRLMVAGG